LKTHAAVASAFLLGAAAMGLYRSGPFPSPPRSDAALVKLLLDENPAQRTFDFAEVVETCSGKRVLPLTGEESHRRMVSAIGSALAGTLSALNREDSPVRKLRRINEASKFFEDGLHARISAMPGFLCEIPPTRAGARQRSGYPDLRITDRQSGLVVYLDPKLIERGSADGTLRTFYFAPKGETLKITDDAVHLLVGIEHDGRDGRWTFTGWRLVDLSTVQVRLKAEFQASNAGLYRKSTLSHPPDAR
jgi:hypothetical protein